jgi:hypothetical protein
VKPRLAWLIFSAASAGAVGLLLKFIDPGRKCDEPWNGALASTFMPRLALQIPYPSSSEASPVT